MAHDLMYSQKLGRHAFFSADKVAWHGLGVTVQGAQTWNEAMKLAGLD